MCTLANCWVPFQGTVADVYPFPFSNLLLQGPKGMHVSESACYNSAQGLSEPGCEFLKAE